MSALDEFQDGDIIKSHEVTHYMVVFVTYGGKRVGKWLDGVLVVDSEILPLVHRFERVGNINQAFKNLVKYLKENMNDIK